MTEYATRRWIEVRCANGCTQPIRFVSTPPENPGDTTEGHYDPENAQGEISLRTSGQWAEGDVELHMRTMALVPQRCGVCTGEVSFALMDDDAPDGEPVLLLKSGTPLFEQ